MNGPMVRFVDTNVFLYVMRQDPVYGRTARQILDRIEGGEEAVTSTLVLEEVCAYVVREGRGEGWNWARKIADFLGCVYHYGTLRKESYTFIDMLRAVDHLTKYGIDWNDCIILSQMKRSGYAEIYSNDEHFDKVGWIRRIFQ